MALKQIAFGLAMSGLALGPAAAQPSPKFLFPQDRELRPMQGAPEIERGSPVGSSPSLSTPLTRLDYVLWQIERRLSDHSDAFEEVAGQPLIDGASFNVGYSDELQRIYVSVSLSLPGKPTRPMSETCKAAIARFDDLLLLRFRVGDRRSNWTLGVLQDRAGESDALEFLAKSVVYSATISALYGTASDGGFYQVRCYSSAEGAPILMYGNSMPRIAPPRP